MSKSTNETEGREALIHLHVPAALKARWVRESRAAGMKLTEWIVQRVGGTVIHNMSNTRVMNNNQFAALVALTSLRQTAALDCARRVLVDGVRPSVAADEANITRQQVSTIITNLRNTITRVNTYTTSA